MFATDATVPPVPLQLNLDKMYGPVLIGVFLSCLFYGMTCVQTIVYFVNFAKDAMFVRSLVVVNLLMGAVLVISVASSVYAPLIQHFGNPATLATLSWGTKATSLLASLNIFTIQSFFLFRVYRFSKSWILVVISAPFILVTLGLGLTSTGSVIAHPTLADAAKLKGVNLANDILMAVTDLLLAGLLCFYLYRSRQEIHVKSTNRVITELIKYAIGTGALTGAVALVGFIVRLGAPSTSANQCIYAIIPHMYSNAMLATINLRTIARKAWNNEKTVELTGLSAISAFQPESNGETNTVAIGGSTKDLGVPSGVRTNHQISFASQSSDVERTGNKE